MLDAAKQLSEAIRCSGPQIFICAGSCADKDKGRMRTV